MKMGEYYRTRKEQRLDGRWAKLCMHKNDIQGGQKASESNDNSWTGRYYEIYDKIFIFSRQIFWDEEKINIFCTRYFRHTNACGIVQVSTNRWTRLLLTESKNLFNKRCSFPSGLRDSPIEISLFFAREWEFLDAFHTPCTQDSSIRLTRWPDNKGWSSNIKTGEKKYIK